MALVSSGLLNKEIGCELGISEITVKAHRGQVMRKMRAASLADLVKMAGKLGLAKAREADDAPQSYRSSSLWKQSTWSESYAFVASNWNSAVHGILCKSGQDFKSVHGCNRAR